MFLPTIFKKTIYKKVSKKIENPFNPFTRSNKGLTLERHFVGSDDRDPDKVELSTVPVRFLLDTMFL